MVAPFKESRQMNNIAVVGTDTSFVINDLMPRLDQILERFVRRGTAQARWDQRRMERKTAPAHAASRCAGRL